MTSFDNMGGIISADFIFPDDIRSFISYADKCMVVLNSVCEWKNLKMQLYSFSYTPKQTNEDAGKLFTISGSLNLLPSGNYLDELSLQTSIILRYQLADATYRVIGTPEYPLSYTFTPIVPNKPSGFRGFKLSFEGKQLFLPPLLDS